MAHHHTSFTGRQVWVLLRNVTVTWQGNGSNHNFILIISSRPSLLKSYPNFILFQKKKSGTRKLDELFKCSCNEVITWLGRFFALTRRGWLLEQIFYSEMSFLTQNSTCQARVKYNITNLGWKSHAATQSVCPTPVKINSPFGRPHTFQVRSSLVEARIGFRGWRANPLTACPWATNDWANRNDLACWPLVPLPVPASGKRASWGLIPESSGNLESCREKKYN